MKKLISILLVAMLVISMFPAIVNAADNTATITFNNLSKRESKSPNLQVWKENGITVNYAKGSYNSGVNNDYYNPIRFYAGTTVEVVYPGITKLEFTCSSSTYAGALQSSTYPSGVTATYSGSVVTVTPSAAVNSITITIGKQTRVSSITVTSSATACDHIPVEQADGKAATCTETGLTNSWVCSECGETTTSQKEIPVIDHNYVAGKCTMCQQDEPEGYVLIDITQNGTYKNVVIVATKTGTYAGTYAMSNGNGTGSAPAAVAVTVSDNVLTFEEENLEWDVVNENGTLTIYPAGETEKWLYCTNTNNGVRVGTNDNKAFTIDTTGYLKNGGTSRYLGVYNAQDWRCYDSPDGVNIKEQTFAFYAPKQAAFVSDDELGYDSVEEALTAGSTTLKSTTGAEMPFEVTVDGTTYIGLANETDEYYTYYELTLKMSSITLRGSEAGIYYGAKVTCDNELAQAVDSYGIVLSTNDMPAEREATDNAFTSITGPIDTTKTIMSGSVFNIFEEGLEDSVNTSRGKVSIYAVVYLEIDGQYVFSKQEISWSLKMVVEGINTAIGTDGQLYNKLNADQKAALVDFYKKWAVENEVINGWSVSNIASLYNASLA